MFEEGVAIRAIRKRNVESLGVLKGLLHTIAYAVIVFLASTAAMGMPGL